MTTREAYQILEPAHFLKDEDVVQPLTPEDTETRRRIIELRDDTIEVILNKCRLSKIKESLYDNDAENPISQFNEQHHFVHDLANRLKHRHYIENDNYLLYAEFFNVVADGYNSDVTKHHVKLDKIQVELVKYHKDIIQLAKDLLIPIHKSISNMFENS